MKARIEPASGGAGVRTVPYLYTAQTERLHEMCERVEMSVKVKQEYVTFRMSENMELLMASHNAGGQLEFITPRQSVIKLLDIICIFLAECTRENSELPCNLDLPLEVYMTLLGLDGKNKEHQKRARIMAEEDLNTLSVMTILSKNKEKSTRLPFVKRAEQYYQKKTLRIKLNEEFVQAMMTAYRTQYPLDLLQADGRTRAFATWSKLWFYACKPCNKAVRGFYSLSVETLMRALQLPSIESIRAKNQSWSKEIRKPLENALACVRGLTWYYAGAKRRVLQPAELEEACKSWNNWSALYVVFCFGNTEQGQITNNN